MHTQADYTFKKTSDLSPSSGICGISLVEALVYKAGHNLIAAEYAFCRWAASVCKAACPCYDKRALCILCRSGHFNSSAGATLALPALKGNSPIRGNVCEADKRVPVSGGKGGPRKRWKGSCHSGMSVTTVKALSKH